MVDEYQKELFEEFKKEKGKIEKLANKISKRRKSTVIAISLDNIIFAVIIVILCIIVAFAFGVEKGKRIRPGFETALTPKGPELEMEKEAPLLTSAALSRDKIVLPGIEVGKEETGPKEKLPTSLEGERSKVTPLEEMPYTIQVVSFKERRLAENEVKKLAKKNIKGFIVPSGNWYQVCAGRYKNMKDAKSALNKLASDYKGCFVRKLL